MYGLGRADLPAMNSVPSALAETIWPERVLTAMRNVPPVTVIRCADSLTFSGSKMPNTFPS